MMLPLLSYLLCLFVLWPALRRRFDAPPVRPQPLSRPLAWQWSIAGLLGGRLFALRLQVVTIGGAI